MTERRILIGSPVRQKEEILVLFLQSLERLRQTAWRCDYVFVDDNEDPAASTLLVQFADAIHAKGTGTVRILARSPAASDYRRDEVTHYWNDDLIHKVAGWKDQFIQLGREEQYDALFLVDSDLLLHPETMESLLEAEKPIISAIFWTQWYPESMELPQVWLKDHYWPWQTDNDPAEARDEQIKLLAKLRMPGVYDVGGLGACTLIKREALAQPISFQPLPNLSLWGEDRHFCVRAAALGIGLFVDTRYPAFHIYRDTDLQRAGQYLRTTEPAEAEQRRPLSIFIKYAGPKLVLSMTARNEEGRYLSEALTRHREYIDAAVIIDDGSTDATPDIIHERLAGIPLYYVRNEESRFANEIDLRRQQWDRTSRLRPAWILNLDADEYFEDCFAREIRQMLDKPEAHTYLFRLYDFWNEHQYRDDACWQAHMTYRPFLARFSPGFPYQWNEAKQHCGRFPRNIFDPAPVLSDLRLKHFGWARESDRRLKAARYAELDPDARYGWKEQYDSILGIPRLVDWQENESSIDSGAVPAAMK
ncbi:glycosyltransferase [Paenibacillus sacheonensis]|uniref:Glycosyltransferase n=1 Tax=Paenibacillus sacheonensis TaxID=742054 RepID=A0A7X4YJV0_9BACL|nr:glycosyltransferase [Paenibacillus sacheonensis]MBM7563934.1 GT2 family glycosyltransferase [Paenibacillus sacheonensis]NBC67721.1 glycosyltransferase [Paenibacillus sacheonensis]